MTVLGAPIGTDTFVKNAILKKVSTWSNDILKLAEIADTHPHAAFSAFGHGLSSRWTYFCRVVPLNESDLQPLEDAIQDHLVPSISGVDPLSTLDREWINLPIRFGGLGLCDPRKFSSSQYKSSISVCSPLIDNLLEHSSNFSYEDQLIQRDLKNRIMAELEQQWQNTSGEVFEKLSVDRRRLMELAQEKGASSWLSTLPLSDHGFSLNKSTFRDALCLRFGWTLPELPSVCVCGKGFSVEHALNCPMGGLQTRRHNEIRDLTADMLKEVCPSVSIEPSLLPLRGEKFESRSTCTDIGARLDIAADNFWEAGRRTFFDVRIFNPLAATYQKKSLKSCYSTNEHEKMRKFDERIREVEFGSFSPLIFSTTGGFGMVSNTVYKKLATLLSVKHNKPYSTIINYIRCRISFSLIRSTVLCVRGTRSSPPSSHWDHLIAASDLAMSHCNS